ncbi:MAG: Gfo/Idh/MocA family oxidoreductase, partial [Betaproteobacteria bacterium]|nr:Gfo/Idh/MocA family oxidoreductase [Betaproteobacteria bacterium]
RHADSAIASGRFRVVRAVVRNKGPAEEFARERSIALSTDLAETLADPGVHAVSIVTPHTQHADQIIAAAQAGKHVLAEKPFALTRADAERATGACTKAGVVVGVGHDNRFYSVIAEIRRLLQAGTLGNIFHVEANLSHNAGRQARSSAPPPGTAGVQAWRLNRAEGPAGPITHLGIHRIDTFVQLFGPIDQVFAQESRSSEDSPTPSSVAVMVRFRNGMTGYLGSSQKTPLNSRMQIFGSKAWLEARGAHDMQEYWRSSFRRVSVRSNDGGFETRRIEPLDSVKLNFEAFADAIEGRTPYPVPPGEIVHVVAVAEAVVQSLETGLPVSVP